MTEQSATDLSIDFFESLDKAGLGVRQAVWELLLGSDREFVPALSTRHGPSDTSLNQGDLAKALAPRDYFNEMAKQPILVGRVDGKIVGFLSFKTDYLVPEILTSVDAYVSTLIVSPQCRGKKISLHLYESLFTNRRIQCNTSSLCIATRTWSTNWSHLTILEKLGFACALSKKDARGQGIDTVIYTLSLE